MEGRAFFRSTFEQKRGAVFYLRGQLDGASFVGTPEARESRIAEVQGQVGTRQVIVEQMRDSDPACFEAVYPPGPAPARANCFDRFYQASDLQLVWSGELDALQGRYSSAVPAR